MRFLKRFLVGLLILVVVVGIGVFLTWNILLSYINRPTEATTTAYTGVGTQPAATTTEPLATPVPEVEGITNLLLLGVDNRVLEDSDEEALSDVVIVVTIDKDNKVVKLTSFQRDMLVYVAGVDQPVKLSETHKHGGAMATLRTLNENFRLDLEDYVEVNIYEAERLIDIVGGVELDVAPEFLLPTNECISMQNIFFPDTPPVAYLEEPGLQQLNGRQAVGYARFRKIDSDYKRMGRQREVLQAVFASFMDAGLTAKFNMMTSGLSAITTTLSNGEITNLAIHVAPVLGNEILQKQVPDPTTYRVNFYETSDTKVRVDLNTIIPSLHQFVYNDEYPFQPVKEIPGAPNSSIPLPAGLWRLDVDPSPTPIPTETSEATTTQASETPAPAA